MGSGGLNGVSGRSGYGGRTSAPWSLGADEAKEPENRDEFHNGRGYRPNSSDEPSTPQFLVEADDLYDDEYGESRLVAPPVLGEAPQGYRDF